MIALYWLAGVVVVLASMTAVLFVWMRFELWLQARRRVQPDEPLLFDTADEDPLTEHFAEAQRTLLDLIPAAPLCPPALRRWKGIEASLAHDPEFMLPVLDALRQRPTT